MDASTRDFFLKLHAFFQAETAAVSVETERYGTLTREQVALVASDLTAPRMRVVTAESR